MRENIDLGHNARAGEEEGLFGGNEKRNRSNRKLKRRSRAHDA